MKKILFFALAIVGYALAHTKGKAAYLDECNTTKNCHHGLICQQVEGMIGNRCINKDT